MVEEVEVIVALANQIKIPLLKIRPIPKPNQNSGGRGYRGRGRGYRPGRRQTPTPPGKPEGWNRLCSGVETLLLLMMLTTQLDNAHTTGKSEKIGGNINSKHLFLNLLLLLLKTHLLRETSKGIHLRMATAFLQSNHPILAEIPV